MVSYQLLIIDVQSFHLSRVNKKQLRFFLSYVKVLKRCLHVYLNEYLMYVDKQYNIVEANLTSQPRFDTRLQLVAQG